LLATAAVSPCTISSAVCPAAHAAPPSALWATLSRETLTCTAASSIYE